MKYGLVYLGGLLAVLAAVQAAGLIPLGLALRDRLKEIKGGELYEARQY